MSARSKPCAETGPNSPSSPQHTPGPWYFTPDSDEIFAADDEIVAVTWCVPKRGGLAEGKNARLIAAAPDLLEALATALGALDASRSGGAYPDFEVWEALARAAIAKAEGRS